MQPPAPVPHPEWRTLYDSSKVRRAINYDMRSEVMRISPNQGKTLVLIAILKGGVWTTYRLLDALSLYYEDIRVGHMGISSYGNGRKPDQMKVTSTLDLSVEDVQGADVWLVDDIWDTGATMLRAKEIVSLMHPESLKTAVLVRRVRPEPLYQDSPDVAGFRYHDNGFLAGCGMGCGELHRHHDRVYRSKRRRVECFGSRRD